MRTATNGQYDIDSRPSLEPGRLSHFRGAAVIIEVKSSFARLNRASRGRFAEFDREKDIQGLTVNGASTGPWRARKAARKTASTAVQPTAGTSQTERQWTAPATV